MNINQEYSINLTEILLYGALTVECLDLVDYVIIIS